MNRSKLSAWKVSKLSTLDEFWDSGVPARLVMAAFEDRYRMGVSLTMINQERIARNIPRYRHSEDHYKMLGDISIAEAGKRKVSEAWLNRRPPYTKKQIAGFKMLNKWGRA